MIIGPPTDTGRHAAGNLPRTRRYTTCTVSRPGDDPHEAATPSPVRSYTIAGEAAVSVRDPVMTSQLRTPGRSDG
ncbi:hypothetical protein GCM10010415_12830 [Streptomyces atrovirens]